MERVDGSERGRVEYIYKERVASNGTSTTSQAEIGDANSGVSRRGKESIRTMERLDDEYSTYSREAHNRMDYDLKVNRQEYENFMGEDIRNQNELLRSRPPTDQWGIQGRFNYVGYHDEGPPRYSMNSSYEQSERARYRNHVLDGPPTFENLENNRAELLRELDNLKDQLSGSSDMTKKPRGWISTNRRMISPITADPAYPRNHAAYVQESLSSSHVVNQPSLGPDDMAPQYFRQAPGFVSYTDRDRPSLRDSYPQRGYPHEYADTYHQQEMYQRSGRDLRSEYMHLPYHEHFHGYHGNENHDPFVHPNENFLDQPACSCVQCCNKNRYLPPKVDPSGLYNQRSLSELSGSMYHHQLYPTRHGQQGHNNSSSFNVHTTHSRKPLVLNSTISESDETTRNHPRKALEAPSNGQVWHPIAGGAPVIACCNCFELLKLPTKLILFAKKQQRLKCGACSSIILFELGTRGTTVPVSRHVDNLSTEIDDTSSLTVDENVRYQHGDSNSKYYDEAGPKVSPADNLIPSESEKQLDRLSKALSLSEDEQAPEKLTSEEHGSPFAELHNKEVEAFPDSHLSFEEYPDHSSANILCSKFEKGNESKRSDFDYNTTQQDCVEDSEVATEADISVNELLNSAVSEESVDKRKENHHPMVKKGSESLFGSLIKRSFRNFRKSRQDVNVGKLQVVVNGHLIPDHLVEKAEVLAGPIEPGEYWYDVRAGFWGVMGYPCLGLIMPNIEEFNYPMPKKCAGGNTGVFVNGRELHQKDLDLLTGRGLPDTSHGSYLVEISGKVFDQRTGEQLCNLGRLAPTVERAKHGFGMKIPSFIARLQNR